MSSDLSRTLTEAGTNALDKAEAEVYAGRRLARADLRYMAEAAVAAVLETLAADLHESARHHDSLGSIDVAGLRRLAVEARAGEDG